MAKSKKSYLLDLPEISSEIELEEEKTIEYNEHEYTYRVEKYSMFKGYCAVTVSGGPHRSKAMTTCKSSRVKASIKRLILEITHK